MPNTRVAFILSSMSIGGMEMRSMRMAGLFVKRGYAMHFGCPTGSPLAQGLRTLPLDVFPCHMHGSLDLRTGIGLMGYLRKHRVNLLMAFTGTDYWMSVLAGRMLHIPVILSRSTATPLNPLTARVARHADALVAVSKSIREMLRRQGIAGEKIELIYNGVNTEMFSAARCFSRKNVRQAYGIPEHGFVLGCLGRARKGQTVLLAQDERLHSRCPEIHYFFAGQNISDQLAAFIDARPDLRRRVTACDRVAFDQVPALLHALDVVVMLPETEPFSNAVIEAMAMEKPLILSRTTGNREAVEDGVSGRLIDRDDPDRLAAAVFELYGSPELRQRMGAAAARRAGQLFTEEAMLSAYEALWRKRIT